MNVVVADLGMAGLRPRTRAGLLTRGGGGADSTLVVFALGPTLLVRV